MRERDDDKTIITNTTSDKVVEQRRERGCGRPRRKCLSLPRVEGIHGWNGITREVGLQPDGKNQEKRAEGRQAYVEKA